MSRWITADLDSSFVQKYVSDYWRVALGSAWFQKQSWRQWGTEGAERFLTVKGWAPGIQSRRIRATGATPLKRSRRRRKMNSLSRAIKSNATHTVMCVCVLPMEFDVFFMEFAMDVYGVSNQKRHFYHISCYDFFNKSMKLLCWDNDIHTLQLLFLISFFCVFCFFQRGHQDGQRYRRRGSHLSGHRQRVSIIHIHQHQTNEIVARHYKCNLFELLVLVGQDEFLIEETTKNATFN